MTHKEQCRRLKAIRKQTADQIGIDLHQTECTYEGECSGTCPRCAQEEKTLNKALLASAVAVTSVMLTACGMEKVPSGVVDSKNGKSGAVEELGGATTLPEEEFVMGEEEYVPEDDPENIDGGLEVDELAGDVSYVTEGGGEEIEYQLDGDVVCTENDISDQREGMRIATIYTQAPIVEVDQVEENGNYTIHCYEIVEEENGESHTTTWDWITVDLEKGTMTDMNGNEIDYASY